MPNRPKLLLPLFFACFTAAAAPLVFPPPQEMHLAGPGFPLTEPVRILLPAAPSESDLLLARELTADLSDLHGLNVRLEKTARLPASGRFILMGAISNPLVKQYCAAHGLAAAPHPEGYILHSSANVVLVAGSDDPGAFYGLQSLRQLVTKTEIRGVTIRDWPGTPFRGIKLYLPGRDHIPYFKRFVRDFMALYKYNKLIVEFNGAMRLDRHPEINAGWLDLFNDLRYSRRDRSTGPHGEYQDSPNQDVADGAVLEKAEVAGLVQWARRYYVEFIPEVPSLTHSYYLLTRHRELADVPGAEWPDAYCPSNAAVYKLLFDVLDEIIDVTHPRMIHIGHDEWRSPLGVCPRCGNKDRGELYAEDVNKIHAHLAAKGIRVAMYGDHLLERVRGKGFSNEKTRAGYTYKWPGGLTPEQVKAKIPKDILIFNWFWRDGKPGNGEPNDIQLADWGFKQVYMNFEPDIQNYARRSARAGVLGGVPASWAATTEFNFGKDLMYDFLGCAGLVWSKHSYDPKELSAIVQARMPDVRERLSGEKPPSAESDPIVDAKIAPDATTVPIGEDASSLIFLHASEKPAANVFAYRYIYNFVDTADLLGHYEVLYEDGDVVTVPIRYGVNILERTWGAAPKPRSYCYYADPVETPGGSYFAFEWVNPRFGKVIKQVTLKLSSHFQNPVLLRGIRIVKKRPFPEPVQARPYEAAAGAAAVRLPPQAADCVRWAADELTATLGPAARSADIRVTIGSKTGPDEQSYTIRKSGNAVLLDAGGPTGAMYGLQEIAEQFRATGAIVPAAGRPFVEIRADNSFIHVRPLELNNLPMWRAYIDMLARNRYNMLDLHGGYDLDSTDFPNLYPQLVHVPDYPNVGNREEQARNLAAFKAVVAYAKSRGVKVAFMNYSAANGSEGPRKYEKSVTGVPPEKLADYTAKAVAILIREIPDLYMLGFRVGESGQKATFFKDAYLKGVEDSGRRNLPLYTRSWVTTRPQLEEVARAAHAGFDIEIKYNGEQLGLPYQSLQDTGTKYTPSYSYEDYLNLPQNYRIIWQVRANGTHRFFTWEDTAFIRRTVRTFHLGNAAGFTLEPPTAYFSASPAAYYTSKADQDVYSYIWQKHWMWYYAWGRLGYNPDLPESRIIAAFQQHYGAAGPAIYRALQAGGEIVPLVFAYRFQGPDQRQYSPETETGNFYEHKKVRKDLLQFAYGEPADPRSFAGIDEFVNEKIAGQPDGRVAPPVVAARLNAAANRVNETVAAVPALNGAASAEWRLLKTDLLSTACLGRYHADRILAETYLDYALRSRQQSDYDKAVQLLAASRKDWADLAATAEAVYRPLNNPLNHQPDFRWSGELPRLEKLDATASDLWAARPRAAGGPPLHLDAEIPALGVAGLRHTVAQARTAATITCRASAGAAKALLWYKPLPTLEHWQKIEMQPSAAGYSATVPLTPSGLMYLVEVRDRGGHARNFPDVFQETPYRVIPAFPASDGGAAQ